MLMNYTLRFVLSIVFIVYFISAQECSESLFLFEMPVNLLQYRGSVRIFNNRNSFLQFKVSHFIYSSDNNNDNNNLVVCLLILSNKTALVLLLFNLMFAFKGNGSKYKKLLSFGPYFPQLSHVTCFVGFISF